MKIILTPHAAIVIGIVLFAAMAAASSSALFGHNLQDCNAVLWQALTLITRTKVEIIFLASKGAEIQVKFGFDA